MAKSRIVKADSIVPAGQAVVRIRATASNRRFSNVEPGLTVREGGSYEAWDYFRPEQAPPTDPRERMLACIQAYDRVGVIRNAIDMMSEFACQGIDVVHQDPATERFYKEWWRKVRGAHVTERQLNLLYRAGTVPMKRTWGRLSPRDVEKVRRGLAAYDTVGDVKPEIGSPSQAGRIPWRYTILNPVSLEVIGGDVAPLIGKAAIRYGVRINKTLIEQLQGIKSRNTYPHLAKEVDQFLSQLGGGEVVPIPEDDLKLLWYKKDDWQVWPTPMLFSLFRDIQTLEQLKLADMTALDGATSHVRVWRLGSLEKEIYPSQAAVDKLADILAARAPGEIQDLIWGPDIDLLETKTDTSQFLGSEKYIPTWSAIFGGIGVPLSLTGVPGSSAGGTTNNWASLKTLVERLEYGRNVSSEFWQEEIRLVQRAMGFRRPAQLVFDRQSLADEVSILRLFIELMDRNVVSREAVQERFSLVPEIEKFRTRREWRAGKRGTIPPKGGPWDDPTFEHKILFELIKLGAVQPKDAGIDVEVDASKLGEPKGEPGKGRPPGAVDKVKRKSPRFTPRAARAMIKSDLDRLGLTLSRAKLSRLTRDILAVLPAGSLNRESVQHAVIGVFQQITEGAS